MEKLLKECVLYYEVLRVIKSKVRNKDNQIIMEKIMQIKAHQISLLNINNHKLKAYKIIINIYVFMSKIVGYTFIVRWLNKKSTRKNLKINDEIIAKEVQINNKKCTDLGNQIKDEDRLQYVGAIVLGLNDALVELTGTIAGLTFALVNTRLTALAGIVTGISAALSMAASNYLAERANNSQNAFKSSIYTGVAYSITVILMVTPYLIFPDTMYVYALLTMLAVVIFIIFIFNYYIYIAKGEPLIKNFVTMASLSLTVAFIAFIIGLLAKRFLGIDI